MKHKTNKAASKRFTFSAKKKVRRRSVHQSHFNAKDSGSESRRKRSPQDVDPADRSRVQDLMRNS